MVIRGSRFNLNLLLVLASILVCGCQSPASKEAKASKKVVSMMRLHIEARPDSSNRSQPVGIYREHPVTLQIERSSFLNEEQVKEAKIVEDAGGFSIQLQFDRNGSWLLEEYTGANRGRHLAIFGSYALKKNDPPVESRWLAAPRITKRITDGLLVFTPDASREEAEKWVLGLNNMAKQLGTTSKYNW